MTFRAALLLVLPLFVCAAFVGCSSAASGEQCSTLGSLCHEPGETNEEAHECHEVGHDGDADACAEVYDDCIALCEALAGTGGGGGAGGAGGATH